MVRPNIIQDDHSLRRAQFTIFAVFGAGVEILFSVVNLVRGEYFIVLTVMASAATLLLSIPAVYKMKDPRPVFRLSIVVALLAALSLLAAGGAYGSKALWMFMCPLGAYFLFDKIEGTVWVAIVYIVALGMMVSSPSALVPQAYPADFIYRFAATYLFVCVVAWWYEFQRQRHYDLMTIANERLRSDKETLHRSEERFRNLFEASRDAFITIDPVALNITSANSAAAAMFRAKNIPDLLSCALGKLSPELQPDGGLSMKKATAKAAEAMRTGSVFFEWTHKRLDGEEFPADVLMTRMEWDEKTFLHMTLRDITERKQAEASFISVQKLESLGTLAGGIAHDFNNILTAILGNLSLMRARLKPDEDGAELLKEAQDACTTAKGLSHQLLTFAKGGAPVVQVTDLRPLLTQACGFAARGSSARCVYDLGDIPLVANVDRDQIFQVVQNLIINAVQAMPKGGKIEIRGTAVTLGENAVPSLEAGRYIRVTVKDQGIGIPPAQINKIFDPYFSTKAVGRGLGLAVCYSILAKHGGKIQAESTPGTGSAFTFHIPAVDAAELPAEKGVPALPAGSGRVLVMDDDTTVSKALVRMLVSLGYQAELADDGEAALDSYRKALGTDQPYDVVIMDLTIRGGMGGKEAIGQLLALDPKAKVIVSSGYDNNPVIAEYAAYGFSGVLAKPYGIDEVSRVLGRLRSP